jgi:autotransporter-associated beta strand protein
LAAILLAARGYADSLVSCGFEPAGDTWSYTAAGGGIVNANAGAADFPANQRILSGSGSWLVSNTTSVLTYSEVLLAGWSNVTVRYHVTSTAATSGGGATPGDSVAAYVATTTYANQAKAVFGSTADITVTGWGSGATWGYQSDTPPQVKPAGWGQTLHPAGSGLRTTDGFTDFAVSVPNGKRSLALKLYLQNDSTSKRWNLDDVTVEGSPTTSNDRWWDGDGDGGGTVGGGSGGWDNSASRWAPAANGNSYSAWQSANGDNAHFTQAGGTVTIAAGALVAARSLTFAADGYTIAGGDSAAKLALTNGGSGGPGPDTIEVTNPGQTATVNAAIVGNPGVGVTKTGPGTLVLGGVNAFTGPLSVQQGTLRLGPTGALAGCSAIDVAAGATLDLSAVAGGYRLGTTGSQTLQGTGNILGNLRIDPLGIHHVGHSPGVQCVQGDYSMNGLLQVEISGPTLDAGDVGYDQVLLSGTTHNVSLGGALAVAWSGAGWSSPDDRLWIVRNDTDGTLSGAFTGYANGDLVGSYDGRQWRIYYGADAASGQLTGGNDVLLTAAAPVPEPSCLNLLAVPAVLLLWRSLQRLRPGNGRGGDR